MKGDDIRRILTGNGFILKDVAEKMGVTPQNLQSLLNSADIKTGVLEQISKAINKNIYFFFEESKEKIKGFNENECPHCAILREQLEDKIEIIKLQRDLLKAYQVDPTARFSRNGKHKAG